MRDLQTTPVFQRAGLLSHFYGGLKHHVEHHLFPRAPVDVLAKIAPRVERICSEHGLSYHREQGLFKIHTAVWRLLRNVAETSQQLPKNKRAA